MTWRQYKWIVPSPTPSLEATSSKSEPHCPFAAFLICVTVMPTQIPWLPNLFTKHLPLLPSLVSDDLFICPPSALLHHRLIPASSSPSSSVPQPALVLTLSSWLPYHMFCRWSPSHFLRPTSLLMLSVLINYIFALPQARVWYLYWHAPVQLVLACSSLNTYAVC